MPRFGGVFEQPSALARAPTAWLEQQCLSRLSLAAIPFKQGIFQGFVTHKELWRPESPNSTSSSRGLALHSLCL